MAYESKYFFNKKYKDSAYIYVGGFPYEMTEGDIVIVFSQYGEIVDCNIIRDKETGKSKGFGFICYEDQRSTILAVDNLNGADICGKLIRVDHVEQFKIPKEYFEVNEFDENGQQKLYKPSGPDGKFWGEDRILSNEDIKYFEQLQQNQIERESKAIRIEKGNYVMDEDEQWEKDFVKLINNTKEQEIKEKEERKLKKKMKKEKKEKKKEKKRKKLERKKEKESEELKDLYKEYNL